MQRFSLPGYRGIKAEILVALKKSQPLTVKALADRFDLTGNAMRRHLDGLEEDGVVTHKVEVRGVGAPVHEFSLTADGEELFPQAYLGAFAELLDVMKASVAKDDVLAVFRRRWDALAKDAEPLLAGMTFPERAQLLAELLSAQGYMAEADSPTPVDAILKKHHCAVKAVAERFPEVCETEQAFFELVLGTKVTRDTHILDGCSHCSFSAHTV